MPERPLLLLAFANIKDDYLPTLKEESRHLSAALEGLHDKQAIEVYREESAERRDIAALIQRFRDRIVVFHYAGHAASSELLLEDGSADATGLAQLLSQLQHLQLVFLNGCSTVGQVIQLMELGVKAVIATSSPINDTQATEFAEHFYRALANKSTIRSAFDFAVSALRLKYGNDAQTPRIEYFRSAAAALRNRRDQRQPLPWGLYLQDTADEKALQWTLPTRFTSAPVASRPDIPYRANDYLIDILYAITQHDPELSARTLDSNGQLRVEGKEALAIIIERFPYMIGVQIRLLIANEAEMRQPSMTRLRQIISTYTVTAQTIFYILLSQVWEERKANPDRPLADAYLLSGFAMDQATFEHFDYVKHIIQAISALRQAGTPLFTPELDTWLNEFEQRTDFYNAYLYLESIQSTIAEDKNLDPNSLPQICADAEFALSELLIKSAFIVKYPMIVVRDILINRPRHLEAQFRHVIGRLNLNTTLALDLHKKPLVLPTFMHNASVILLKSLEGQAPFINLSPFIIDRNAFLDNSRATEPHLFLYAFRRADEYVYLNAGSDIYRAMLNPSDQLDTGLTVQQDEPGTNTALRASRFRARTEANTTQPFSILKEQFAALHQAFMAH